ncbi:MAG: DUF4126 domain-containing protein [Vicinamibacteria bacterium]
MEAVNWLEIVPSLALGIGLAACAGLRAWLPLLLLGGLARWGVVDLSPSFEFVASTRALILFGVATVVEIAGDKIPAVDHTLDVLSTVLRPAAGSLLAASVLWQVSDPLTAAALGIAVGAPSALVPHAAKSTLRIASTTFTGGLANPVLSFLEDAAAFVFFVLTVVLPVLAAGLVFLTGFLVARRLLRRASPPPAARPAPAP